MLFFYELRSTGFQFVNHMNELFLSEAQLFAEGHRPAHKMVALLLSEPSKIIARMIPLLQAPPCRTVALLLAIALQSASGQRTLEYFPQTISYVQLL